MPEPGDYLFSNVGFSPSEKPYLAFEKNDTFTELTPLSNMLTLRFNMNRRYCIGWGNIGTKERFPCPDHNEIDAKYEQCPACQQRTGFNPAFYNATTVSKQQETHNQQPHILYLAHFAKGLTKVGISFAGRGKSRLLEQGARSALILDTLPSALIARQYEAQIATLPNIAETIQLRKKITSFSVPYDSEAAKKELLAERERIEVSLGKQFSKNDVLSLDHYYFSKNIPSFTDAYDCFEQQLLSGETVGMLGTILFCRQQDTLLFLPLKKRIGYRVELSYNELPITLPARQISLF
jgi:hypothetical protein